MLQHQLFLKKKTITLSKTNITSSRNQLNDLHCLPDDWFLNDVTIYL